MLTWCRLVSTVHACVACAGGIYWLTASGELAQLQGRRFVFLPVNAQLAAVGCAFFVYDAAAMLLNARRTTAAHLVSMLAHHALFVTAYFGTLVRACVTRRASLLRLIRF